MQNSCCPRCEVDPFADLSDPHGSHEWVCRGMTVQGPPWPPVVVADLVCTICGLRCHTIGQHRTYVPQVRDELDAAQAAGKHRQ